MICRESAGQSEFALLFGRAVRIRDDADSDERIEGLAEESCMAVAQVRNIAGTALQICGPVSTRWMTMAQCLPQLIGDNRSFGMKV